MIREYFRIAWGSLYWVVAGPAKGKPVKLDAVLRQLVLIGVRSLPMIVLLSFFMGLVLGMQSAYTLKNLGAEIFMADLLTVSFFREIGPLLTAIVLAGRCGSAMTAEIGTMKTSEEIEALEVMAIDPIRFLVSPRVLASILIMPSLVILANFAGNMGGWTIGVGSLGIHTDIYVNRCFQSLVFKDIWTGVFKATVFAGLISTMSCFWGMSVTGGAEGVGRATTSSVVSSLVAILAADVLLTGIFYFI